MEFGQKIGSLWQGIKRDLRDFARGYTEEEVTVNRLVWSGQAPPEILESFRQLEIENLTLRMALQPHYNPLTGTEYPLTIKMIGERDALRKSSDNLEQFLQDRARRNLQMWGKLSTNN